MIDPTLNEIDELCVNTIRTLSIDAVQKANSGHPGAPMGAGLMAYVLWDRVLKHNPGGPALARPRSLRALGRSRVDAAVQPAVPDGLPASRSTTSRTSGSGRARRPATPSAGSSPGIETTTGPLGPGLRDGRRDGDGRALPRGDVQPPGPRDRRPLHVRARERRRPAGGHLARGGVVRRPPAARQADRALRRQPRPARRADATWRSARTSASASRRTAGTSSASTAWTTTPVEAALRAAQADGAAVDHRRAHAHRLRQPEQAGQRRRRTARRSARTRSR